MIGLRKASFCPFKILYDTASMFTDYSVRGNMMNLEKTGYLRYTCICYFMPYCFLLPYTTNTRQMALLWERRKRGKGYRSSREHIISFISMCRLPRRLYEMPEGFMTATMMQTWISRTRLILFFNAMRGSRVLTM